jgi:hypothetical protein
MTAPGPRVFAIHENPQWFGTFQDAFDAEGVPVEEWILTEGMLDLDDVPPEGVFWSRISASSHTRGHVHSKDYARAVLSWLDAHGRRVVNGRRVLELEMSKVDQLTALKAFGIEVPRTIAVVGTDGITDAAHRFRAPFIIKHNQGGKGLSVQRFEAVSELETYLREPDYEPPQDGITLVQEYVHPAAPFITRVEIVGGKFIYAITADTEHGGFQLCPADACAVDPSTGEYVIPPGATAAPLPGQGLFELREGFDHPIIERYLAFTRTHGIEIAGIEFIETADGRIVTYDVNTNTNYNADVENVAPQSAPRELAKFLGRELAESGSASLATHRI